MNRRGVAGFALAGPLGWFVVLAVIAGLVFGWLQLMTILSSPWIIVVAFVVILVMLKGRF